MSGVPVVLDTDLAMGAPGSDVDDGFALAMVVADPGIDLRLVTTVYGNTDVHTATSLSHELLSRLGRPVPVVRGADRSLSAGAVPNPAVDAIIETVMAEPGRITVVPIGPLTNVALALRQEPNFAAAVGELVIMGGLFDGTGPRQAALPGGARGEWNVWNDPEAAQFVLDSGVRTRWVGLDVTRQVRITRSEARAMAESGRGFEAFAGTYTLAWIDHIATTGMHPGEDADSCALHDPLAVAVVTRPELVRFAPVRLRVGLGEHERGVMYVEDSDDGPTNAEIGVAVDSAGFGSHFRSLLADWSRG